MYIEVLWLSHGIQILHKSYFLQFLECDEGIESLDGVE